MNPLSLSVQSSGFADGDNLPPKFATTAVAGGKNVSPALAWSGAPDGTRSFAILMQDPHPVAKHWVHWVVVDIPKKTDQLEEGASKKAMPLGSQELITSWGRAGYDGPQPPPGSGKHPYEITAYAMNVGHLEIPGEVTYVGFLKAIEGKVLASGKITGYFER